MSENSWSLFLVPHLKQVIHRLHISFPSDFQQVRGWCFCKIASKSAVGCCAVGKMANLTLKTPNSYSNADCFIPRFFSSILTQKILRLIPGMTAYDFNFFDLCHKIHVFNFLTAQIFHKYLITQWKYHSNKVDLKLSSTRTSWRYLNLSQQKIDTLGLNTSRMTIQLTSSQGREIGILFACLFVFLPQSSSKW